MSSTEAGRRLLAVVLVVLSPPLATRLAGQATKPQPTDGPSALADWIEQPRWQRQPASLGIENAYRDHLRRGVW